MTLEQLNRLPIDDVKRAFQRCCGARAWVEAMSAGRPFPGRAALLEHAERAAGALHRQDWLEAFAQHPRIGEPSGAGERLAATAAWAKDEQRGAEGASAALQAALARGNRAYEDRFGYGFIVCATGKSADQMLGILESRLSNAPDRELAIAAAEQVKITRLRLEKLLEEA